MVLRVAGKGVWLWLVVVALSAVLAAGLAWTSATTSLSSQAGRLDTVDLALGSAAVTRAGASQAVVMATNHAAGTASTEALSAAISELSANAEAYRQLATQTGVAGTAFSDSTDDVVLLLQQGAVDDARSILEGPLQGSYVSDVAALSSLRDAVVADIDGAASVAAGLSGWLRLLAVVAVPLAVALIVHLTARRRLRVERTQLLAVVNDSSEEAAQAGELLSDASHRLRTPLTSIYGLSEVLAQSKRVTGLERELATLVHAEAAEMYRVADDVLALTQMRDVALPTAAVIVALPDIIDEAAKPAKAAGVEIKIECPEVWVLSDPHKVQHIVRNLVSNAVAHGAEPIFVEVSEVDGRVECVVIDHGPGLPADIEPDAGRFADSGHGLEIAYWLSENIGATLTHRRDGDQTRFCLSFTDEGPDAVATPRGDR